MNSTMKGRLFAFYAWMSRPTTISSLKMVLKKLTDDDLRHIMSNTASREALTLAWAEFGRRHANVNLEFEMSSTEVLSIRASNLVFAQGVAIA